MRKYMKVMLVNMNHMMHFMEDLGYNERLLEWWAYDHEERVVYLEDEFEAMDSNSGMYGGNFTIDELVGDFEDYIDDNGFFVAERWRFMVEDDSGDLILRDMQNYAADGDAHYTFTVGQSEVFGD